MGEPQVSGKSDKLTDEEIMELARRSAQGDARAREQLLLSHLYLVDQLVHQNLGRGVDQEDLFQDGCYGLIQAIDRYDPTRGARLKTYATYWINKQIKQCIHEQNLYAPISMPEGAFYSLQRYRYSYNYLFDTLARPPSDEELASHMGISIQKLRKIYLSICSYISLDMDGKNPGRPGDRYTEHLIPLQKLSPSAEEEALKNLCPLDLASYGVTLTPREMEILCRHLGFTPEGDPEPHRVIAKDLGLSLEAVRKEYWRAIKKIRNKVLPDIAKQPQNPQSDTDD